MGNVPPSFFHDAANRLQDAYTQALDKVVAVYPKYATYNTLPQNKMEYDQAIQDLAGVEASYGFYKWFLIVCMQYADYNMKQMDSSTTLIAADVEKLEKKLYDISGEAHAASGALNDSNLLYNQQLLTNFILCFIVLGVCYLYYRNDTPQYSDIRKSLPTFVALSLLTAFITLTLLRKIWSIIGKRV